MAATTVTSTPSALDSAPAGSTPPTSTPATATPSTPVVRGRPRPSRKSAVTSR
ncbi:hypothetical protein ACFQES_09695 [Nonomuraea salmonea]|uniref:hypothetical protein n=1 Tax=Nonomuraea salmonea TaxID=46181 RepID=UPI00361E628C